MKTIELECCLCGKKFQRRKSEVERNEGLGRRSYCSRSCCGKDNISNIPEDKKVFSHLRDIVRTDEFSPFRFHLKNAKEYSKKKKEDFVQITLQDLKDQWEKQQGFCPYTGWKLENMKNTSYKNQLPLTPNRASLDRIDSSKGYAKGNIQFVSVMAQFAKHQFTEQQLREFCEAVVFKGQNNGSKTQAASLWRTHHS